MGRYSTDQVCQVISLLHTNGKEFKKECTHLEQENHKLKKENKELRAGKPLTEIEDDKLTNLIDNVISSVRSWRLNKASDNDDVESVKSSDSSGKRRRNTAKN